jgi:hypothetical protein
MVYLVGLPHEKDTGNDQPGIWINPDQIVQLRPLIDGAPNARRLIVEIKMIGLPIIRCHFGTFGSAEELDARWQQLLKDLAPGQPETGTEGA